MAHPDNRILHSAQKWAIKQWKRQGGSLNAYG